MYSFRGEKEMKLNLNKNKRKLTGVKDVPSKEDKRTAAENACCGMEQPKESFLNHANNIRFAGSRCLTREYCNNDY